MSPKIIHVRVLCRSKDKQLPARITRDEQPVSLFGEHDPHGADACPRARREVRRLYEEAVTRVGETIGGGVGVREGNAAQEEMRDD